MATPSGPPQPGEWLNDVLARKGYSKATAARMIGRSREEITRWTSGREKIPRPHLAELASQLVSPHELGYALQLKDCEEFTERLRRHSSDIARKLRCEPDTLANKMLDTIAEITQPHPDSTLWLGDWLSGLTAAMFTLRTWNESVASNNSPSLIDENTIANHLRFPVNYFVGALLKSVEDARSPDAAILQMNRELGLAEMRSLTRESERTNTAPIIRHHALHMIARYGDLVDQVAVTERIAGGTAAVDALSRKLGYCGLIMRDSAGSEIADEFAFYLSRDTELARVDLAFDATHYGDQQLTTRAELNLTATQFTGLADNIAKHYENPGLYSPLREVDAFRMLQILERGGREALSTPTKLRLARSIEMDFIPRAGIFTRALRNQLGKILHDESPVGPRSREQALTETANDNERYDIFLAHNSGDRQSVLSIAECLRDIGVSCWLDQWSLRPGQVVQEVIEQVLPRCASMAVFFGDRGLGRWERMEMRYILSLFTENPRPVIPIILKGRALPDAVPPFLREFHSIFAEDHGTPEKVAALIKHGVSRTSPRGAGIQ